MWNLVTTMVNSRSLDDLRPDVRANCEVFLELCREEGLNVLVTQTLRDDEYQASLYAQGRTKPGSKVTNSKVTTFHGKGLAFDFCKNRKGHEFDDDRFFERCGEIAKQIGFSWGGDWRSFPDRPHIQWDAAGEYSGNDVRAGKLPPEMEEYMTQEQFDKMMDAYLDKRGKMTVSPWAKNDWEAAKNKKITDGNSPQSFATREQVVSLISRAMK